MIRRIASACLALLILISALPLGAAAVQVGDTVWLAAGENPGAGWEPKVDEWMRNNCDLEGHVHDKSCVSDNLLVCKVAPGTHVHDQSCGYYDTQYQWIYTGSVTGEPTGTPTTLTVCNMDPSGNPVVGAEFFLYEEKGAAIVQIGETVTTDADGKATFQGLALPENVTEATWHMAQKSLGEAEENYRPNNAKYKVTIVRNDDDTHTVSVEEKQTVSVSKSVSKKVMAAAAAEGGTTTIFINELQERMLLINMKFVNDVIPKDSYKVKLTGPSGFREDLVFSADIDGKYWQALVNVTRTGTYTVELDEKDAQAEGYTLTTSYSSQLYNPNAETLGNEKSGNTIKLNSIFNAGTLTITNHYKMPVPETVVLKAMDTHGNPLGGAGYGVFYGKLDLTDLAEEPVLDTDGDGEQIIPVADYLAMAKKYLEEGVPETVILKQNAAPAGYDLSQSSYPLTVTKVNGELEYVIEGAGAQMNGGVMTLPFLHEAKSGKLTVKLEPQGTIPESVTEFTVHVSDGKKSWDLTFPAAGGEKRLDLPMGEYTVMLDTEAAKVAGYDMLSPVYSSQKVSFAADGDTADCTITTGYERIKDPANRVLVKAVDSETEATLTGAEFVLVDESGRETKLTKSNADGSYLVENLEDLAVAGETVTYYLRQSKVPFGYRESEDEYEVLITESRGVVTVKTRRNANAFSRLLRSGVEKEPEYGQTAVFINEAFLVDLTVSMELEVNFGKLPLEKIPVTITGENFEETFELGHYDRHTLKNLPLGEYTITQQAEVKGYTLYTSYSAYDATVTGNKLTLSEDDAELEIRNSYDNSAGELEVYAYGNFPEELKSVPVEITDAEGNVTAVNLTKDGNWVQYGIEMAPGTYTVAIAEEDILLKDYILDSTTATAQTVTVKSKEETDCDFELVFKKAGTDVPTTVQFSIRDQFERVVPGATIHISTIDLEVTDNGELDQNKDDSVITVDLTDTMATVLEGLGENSHLTLWLKQTGAPEGYAVSSVMVPITLEKIGPEFQCIVGSGATTVGNQIFVSLENQVLDTATIRTKLNLTGDIPQSIIEYYGFPVQFNEKTGYSDDLWIYSGDDGNGEKELPLGEYTISMSDWRVEVEGYDHTIRCNPETVTLSENGQVEECVVTIQYTKKVTKGTLNLSLNFGETAPEGLDSVTVVAKDANGKTTSIPVTAANQWKTTMDLPEGEYTFDVNPVDGYDISVIQENIKAPVAQGTPVSVTLSLTAEKAAEAVQVEFDKIVLYMKDPKGNLLPGAKVSAYVVLEDLEIPVISDVEDGGDQDADKTEDGKFELSGITAKIEKYKNKLSEGDNILKLKQTGAPEGYTETSKTVITVIVTKTGNDLTYSVAGATIEDRVMYLTMDHPMKTGILNLEIEMKGSSVPESVTEIEVTATDTETGENYVQTVTEADEWKLVWNLPLGTYDINQDPESVAVEGYNLVTVTEPESVTVTEEKEESCTITNTYSRKASAPVVADQGKLKVSLKFKDNKAPEGVASIPVNAKNAAGKTTKITVAAKDNWTGEQELDVGSYTLSLSSVQGYTLTAAEKDIQVTVRKNQTAEAAMTVSYEKSADTVKPSDEPSTEEESDVEATGKLTIRTVDEKGNLWGGAKYGLFYGSDEIRSFTDYGTGVIKIDDPELVMGIYTNTMIGTNARLMLKQTRTPEGADELSERMYTVRVLKQDKKIMLEAEGAEVDSEGTQIVEFSNRHPAKNSDVPAPDTDSSDTIVIRTLDDAGNALTGAEYCLSADQYFDKDEDTVYSEADRHGEIVIKDLHKHLGSAKSATYYLMQSRQPDNSKLSADTFKVELSWKNGRMDVKVKKDEGLFDTKTNGNVEEGTDGEWIVNFVSKQKMTTIQVNYTETVNWNNALKVEDMLQGFLQEEYEFLLKWDYLGEPQEPLTLKLRGGESGSFEPIPNGARYEIVPPAGAFKVEAKEEDLQGRAAEDTVNVDAKIVYNILPGAPLAIDMVRIDAETEKPLAGAVYTLKDADKEVVDTYKTRSDGQFVVDAITAPGEYTLTETETPNGYSKVKKAIKLNVALKLEQSTDSNGDPVILQKLEADVAHSMVKQLSSGAYRIGSAQDKGNGLIIAGAVAAAAGAAGAGALLLRKRKRKSLF